MTDEFAGEYEVELFAKPDDLTIPDLGKETFMSGSMMNGKFTTHPVPNPFNPSTTITFGLEKPETEKFILVR